MLKAKTRKNILDKNNCSKDQQQEDRSRFNVATCKFMLLILVFWASIIASIVPIYAQPTKNLEANYYNYHNRWSSFTSFRGTVIETRTWDRIDTTNYNPQGRGNYWSVDIQGYIYIPSNGSYQFETYSDDGVRLRVDGNTVINNWTFTGQPSIQVM